MPRCFGSDLIPWYFLTGLPLVCVLLSAEPPAALPPWLLLLLARGWLEACVHGVLFFLFCESGSAKATAPRTNMKSARRAAALPGPRRATRRARQQLQLLGLGTHEHPLISDALNGFMAAAGCYSSASSGECTILVVR